MKTALLALTLIAAGRGAVRAAPAEATSAAYAALQRDPLLVAYVHPYRLMQGRTAHVASSGALGVNLLFERGAAKARYIEE